MKHDSLIVTQMPLPHTIVDLWRLVKDWNCDTIVMLNSTADENVCDYIVCLSLNHVIVFLSCAHTVHLLER